MIEGKNTRLRAIERADLPFFVRWLNDPEVIAGLYIVYPLSLAKEENWFEEMLKRPQVEHPMTIEVRQGDEWQLIGVCGFDKVDWRSRSGEVGIFIGEKKCWNQGLGTEIMQLLVNHGFATLNLNRISLEVFDNNLRAIRAYEKAGFTLEGRKRQGIYKGGKYYDLLMMSILRQEWVEL